MELIDALREKILAGGGTFLYEVNRETLEIHAKATFKRSDCNCNLGSSAAIPKALATAFDGKNNRQLSFAEVREN